MLGVYSVNKYYLYCSAIIPRRLGIFVLIRICWVISLEIITIDRIILKIPSKKTQLSVNSSQVEFALIYIAYKKNVRWHFTSCWCVSARFSYFCSKGDDKSLNKVNKYISLTLSCHWLEPCLFICPFLDLLFIIFYGYANSQLPNLINKFICPNDLTWNCIFFFVFAYNILHELDYIVNFFFLLGIISFLNSYPGFHERI